MEILPNNVAVCDGDTHHGVWCRTEGLVHDKFTANLIKGILIENSVVLAIDGGANIGTLSHPMLATGAQVICVEPNPEACQCLAHNLRHFNTSRRKIFNTGLSDRLGRMTLKREANAGASHLVTSNDSKSGIEVITIDSLEVAPGFIKLDIEGMEHHALTGAIKTIERARPVLLLEVNEAALERAGRDPGDIFSFLMEHKYSMRVIQPGLKITDPQFDIVCYPK